MSGQLWLDELATLIGAGRDPVQLRRLVAPLVASRRDPDLMIRVLVAVNRGARRSGTSVSELLQADWAKLIDPLSVQATEIALSDASSDRRLAAIALLGMSGARWALEVLGGLLDTRQPAPVQLAALQALGQVNDPAVGRLVVAHWKAMSPGVRREAAELLFSRRNRLAHLLLPRQPRSAQILTADSVQQQPIAAPEGSEINHGIHRNPRKRESETTSPFRVLPGGNSRP